MIIVNDNIFNAPKNQIICHQVNCQGKMGTGIAKHVKDKFPEVYDTYAEICKDIQSPLGNVWLVQVTEEVHYIANLFAQNYYGRDKRYTDYEALSKCLEKINKKASELGLDLAFPYGMGCNNAGGNWNIVSTMIKEICTDVDVYIYQIGGL